jgi:hypothetical protein
MLWITVLVGTYVIFPPYRATPPAGLADLSAFPRALLHANPDTVWLHAFAMEIKGLADGRLRQQGGASPVAV